MVGQEDGHVADCEAGAGVDFIKQF
jgi:hypothetical protein